MNKPPILKEIDFVQELKQAYLDYSMSVIINRAIPDARDGLKPVQRRILYSMSESGYVYNKPHKKSAKIIGDVLGKYHPHGDSAIYDAMVRMAQDFVMSKLLIDGQGNFGSIDGDNAASMRYTEARLTKIAQHMLADINMDIVDMKPNYDNSITEPSVLPAAFPNLLVNGANGIAVGMATSIPTHNLHEVIDATCAFIDNNDISVSELLEIISGPDFATGGIIDANSNLLKMYETGRGSFNVVGIMEKENDNLIVIKNIPYQVNKNRLTEQIIALHENDDLLIQSVRDESNVDGIRIVIELKKHGNQDLVMEHIYKHTQMQITFHANMLAISNGAPEQMSLKNILNTFIKFREDIVIRRSNFIIRSAKARCHILLGLILAVSDLDKVINLIKSSKNIEDAYNALQQIKWNYQLIAPYLDKINNIMDSARLSDIQTKAILEMRLQSLTNLENRKITDEFESLVDKINDLYNILDDRNVRLKLIKNELIDIKNIFKSPRRTQIVPLQQTEDQRSMILKENCIVIATRRGYVKRVKLSDYRVQKRGGVGKKGTIKSDIVSNIFTANTHQNILVFLSSGYVHSIPAYNIPPAESTSAGRSILNILPIEKNVSIASMLPISDDLDKKMLVFVTESGYVRKNDISDFSDIRRNGKIAMKLEKGDVLHAVVIVSEEDHLFMTSSAGKSARMKVSDLRTFKGRTSKGVTGMSIGPRDKIVSVCTVSEQSSDSKYIFSVTERGLGKRSKISDYRITKRGAKGVITTDVNEDTGPVIGAHAVGDQGELMLMNSANQIIRFAVCDVRVVGRSSKGVRLVKLNDDTKLTSSFYHNDNQHC